MYVGEGPIFQEMIYPMPNLNLKMRYFYHMRPDCMSLYHNREKSFKYSICIDFGVTKFDDLDI